VVEKKGKKLRHSWWQGAEVASSGTSLTSITSSVLRGKVEDGRVYAVYGKEGMTAAPFWERWMGKNIGGWRSDG